MPSDFFDLPPERQDIVLVDTVTVRKAQRLIDSCEHCNSEGAQMTFDYILDCITCSDPRFTDYLLEGPAKCPNCRRNVLEKTLVKPG